MVLDHARIVFLTMPGKLMSIPRADGNLAVLARPTSSPSPQHRRCSWVRILHIIMQ
jgi:hypothetical protein